MPRQKGKAGDFHNGVPNNHAGNKGDQTDNIRSKGELRKARKGELNVDQEKIEQYPADPEVSTLIDKDET